MKRATSSIMAVKRNAAMRPTRRADTREKKKTLAVKMMKMRTGPPERAMLVSRNAYVGQLIVCHQ
jgi:hypothetical protein